MAIGRSRHFFFIIWKETFFTVCFRFVSIIDKLDFLNMLENRYDLFTNKVCFWPQVKDIFKIFFTTTQKILSPVQTLLMLWGKFFRKTRRHGICLSDCFYDVSLFLLLPTATDSCNFHITSPACFLYIFHHMSTQASLKLRRLVAKQSWHVWISKLNFLCCIEFEASIISTISLRVSFC